MLRRSSEKAPKLPANTTSTTAATNASAKDVKWAGCAKYFQYFRFKSWVYVRSFKFAWKLGCDEPISIIQHIGTHNGDHADVQSIPTFCN